MLQLLAALDRGTAIEQMLAGRCAFDPATGAYLRRSNGRRRSGRLAKYYLKMPWHELGEAVRITAYTDEEAVEKANRELAPAALESDNGGSIPPRRT